VIANGALFRAAHYAFETRNRQSLADPERRSMRLSSRAKMPFARLLPGYTRDVDGGPAAVTRHPGFLRGDGDAFFDGCGIVRANFRADASLSGVMIFPRAV